MTLFRTLFALVFAFAVVPAHGVDFEWDGDASLSSWNAFELGTDNTNWVGLTSSTPPDADDTVLFGGVASLSDLTVNLNGDREVIDATFDRAESYLLDTTIGTNTLSLGNGDITVLSGSHTINSNVALLAVGDWNISSGAGLTVAGSIGDAFELDKDDAGTLTLTGNNTYTGLTRVQGGRLVVTGADERIADTSALRVHAGATFELDGITETLGSLSNDAGSIVLSNNAVLKAGADDGQRTYSGVMSGNGSFVKVGTGRQTFTGVNTYTGGTTFENGILRVAADSALGDSSGTLTFNGGTLQLDAAFDLASTRVITMDAGGGTLDTNSFDTSVSQAIGGTGGLTKEGTGTLTLSGANIFTGDTTINEGQIILNNTDALQNSTVSIDVDDGLDVITHSIDANIGGLAGDGTFDIGSQMVTVGSNGEATTFDGVISGTGSLTKTGAGTLTLSGTNTFSGGTTISGGTLQIISGSLPGEVINNATLEFDFSGTLGIPTHNGAITGTGNVIHGGGFFGLSGVNTYTGGTTLNGGLLLLSADSNLGASTGSLNFDGGAVLFTNEFDLSASRAITLNAGGGTLDTNGRDTTVSQAIDGSGGLTKAGTGTLTLSGANTFSGGTTIAEGTLQIGDGGSTGSIEGNIVNFGSLEFNRTGSLTYDGIISGFGDLTKTGAGTLTIGGNNTFTGGTTIDGGTLLANNSTGSATGTGEVIVNSGGTLGGTGSVVGDVTVSGGAIAPGASTGILTLGSIEFDADSLFFVELAGSGGTAGIDFDQLAVGGSASLSGDLEIDLLGGFMPGELDTFSVLTSNTLSGDFFNVADGGRLDTLGGEGSFMVSYDGVSNSVVLSEFLFSTNGDFDDDGDIDGGDFLLWQRGGSPNPLNANDLAIWESSFGSSPLSASSTFVPEPTSLVLLALGGLLVAGRRRIRN